MNLDGKKITSPPGPNLLLECCISFDYECGQRTSVDLARPATVTNKNHRRFRFTSLVPQITSNVFYRYHFFELTVIIRCHPIL